MANLHVYLMLIICQPHATNCTLTWSGMEYTATAACVQAAPAAAELAGPLAVGALCEAGRRPPPDDEIPRDQIP